jgi:monoamine oxidase
VSLFYIRSGTNLNNLLSIEQGAQQHRLEGGMQPLAEKMAEPFRNSVYLNAPVRCIRHTPSGVTVEAEGHIITTQRVILAVPPVLISAIQFSPQLPLRKNQLLQKMSMGIVGKVLTIYPRPFWRTDGFSGQVVADEHAPFQTLFDASPAHAEWGALMAFCIADRARDFFSREEAERRKLTLTTFARYFGEQAATPQHYVDHCWANEAWSQGCYAALYPTGAWTNFQDTLAAPVGPIHFAGTETSKVWYGYIEGAVRAGEREFRRQLALYIRKKLNTEKQKYIASVSFLDSQNSDLIQMADMVAGTLHRFYKGKDDGEKYLRVIRHRQAGLQVWPPINRKPKS